MKNKDELVRKLRTYDGETLLACYEFCGKHFNPIDDENVETFYTVREEVIRRLDTGKEGK